jgi:hypothetical protein
MLLAISGGHGLFSQLQHALTQSHAKRVRLTKATLHQLDVLYYLALDVANRPTRIAELFPTSPPYVIGATDAALAGMGGVAFVNDTPYVWRSPFPEHIQTQLITSDNPGGSITNSDLELAATILHDNVLCAAQQLRERTVLTGCDNISAVSWRNKGSTSTNGPASYLLAISSLRQRHHRHVSRVTYLPGPANVLADTASRRFDLNDDELLSHLNTLYPQTQPWQMLPIPPELHSMLISALLRKPQDYTSLGNVREQRIESGPSAGSHFSQNLEWNTIPFSQVSTTKYPSYASLPNAYGTDAPAAVANPSQLTTWLTKSSTLRKRSKNWGPRILDKRKPARLIYDTATSFKPSRTTILPRNG